MSVTPVGISPRSRRLTTWAAIVTIVAWLVFLFGLGATRAMHFDGPEADGPFQLFNLLRRISAGQHPGIDFPVFHGVAIPYVHYPLFKAMGGDLHASELARATLPILLHVLCVVAFLWAWTRRADVSLWLTAVLLIYPAAVLTTLYLPGNSGIGVRAASPMLIAAAIAGVNRSSTRVLLAGVLLSLALSLGVEQGAAAAAGVLGAFAIASMVSSEARRQAAWLQGLSIVGIGIVGFLLMLVAIAGVEGAQAVVQYQLQDLPGDQLWFFGVPPSNFVGRWSDLYALWWVGACLVLAAALAVYLWRNPVSGEAWHRETAGTALLLSGVIACASFLGISAVKYGAPLFRDVLVVLAATVASGLARAPRARSRGFRWLAAKLQNPGARLFADALCIACLAVAAFTIVSSARLALRALRTPRLSPRLERDLALGVSVIRSVRPNGSGVRTWSTYAGLLEAHLGVFQPGPDYIIHALGDSGRARYLRRFDAFDPDVVQTVRPSKFHGYEEWLQTTTWPFYERLIARYSVAAVASKSIFWRRTHSTGSLPVGDASPALFKSGHQVQWDGHDSSAVTRVVLKSHPLERVSSADIMEDPARLRLIIVDLEYEARNPWRSLPLVGQMPRFFVRVENARNELPISVPPLRGSVRFPVYLDPRSVADPVIRSEVVSLLPGAQLRFSRVRWEEVSLPIADSVLVGS